MLKLSEGILKDDMIANCLQGLQELKLDLVLVSSSCLEIIVQQASRLTFLDLNECTLESEDNVQLPVAKSLR